MKSIILLIQFFLLSLNLLNGQTQEATTTFGKKVILNADGTWKYAEVATTLDGKKIILNNAGTWKYAEVDIEGKRIEAEQQRQTDILNRTKNALANSRNPDTNSNGEGISGGQGNQGSPIGSVDSNVRGEGSGWGTNGVSYGLQGRGFRSLPAPKYGYQGEGRIVVEVIVDRTGKVTKATPGAKGSTTLDEYLLKVSKDAALEARFDEKPDAPIDQKGTITYNFKLK